jgi:hypothetical protein
MKTTLISLFMLLLAVSLVAVIHTVNFDNTSDLSTYFNNSYVDVTNSATGGINNSGALRFPLLNTVESRTVTFNEGYTITEIDQPIIISAYIYSMQNGGYTGLGISSRPTNTTSILCQVTDTPALGMMFYSSKASLYNNSNEYVYTYTPDIPLSWYKVVLTITPQVNDAYVMNYKLYRTDSVGSFLTLTKEATQSVTNTTLGNVDGKVYPYLTASWHRVPYMDNFYFEAPDAPPTPSIVPTVISDPIVADVFGDLAAAVSNPVVGLYACSFTGTSDLDIPILGNQRAFAYYNDGITLGWHEGDYDLNPGFAKWVNVPFGAKGSIPVVVIDPADTLPVTLSSFTAVPAASSFVALTWVTESESNMVGYRVYRGESNDPSYATLISPVMIDATNTSTQVTYRHEDREVNQNTTYYYWLESVSMSSSELHGPISATITGNVAPELPTATIISNAYPNPFRMGNDANIDVVLKAGESGIVTVYNIHGQSVKTFPVTQGTTKLTWNGRDSKGNVCGSGLYFYKLSTPSMNQTRKMVIIK